MIHRSGKLSWTEKEVTCPRCPKAFQTKPITSGISTSTYVLNSEEHKEKPKKTQNVCEGELRPISRQKANVIRGCRLIIGYQN